jgi:FkbM family methyltransferase
MYEAGRASVRRLLQRAGRRWPDPELLEHAAALQSRLDSLCLVKTPPLRDAMFTHVPPDGSGERQLYGSGFNPAWIDEVSVDPKVIFDIGSYDGGDSIRLQQKFPRAQIVAFEADPQRFAVVSRNVAPLGIRAINAAVCDRDGPISWYQSVDGLLQDESAGSQGSIFRHSEEYSRQHKLVRQSPTAISVAAVRLDKCCREIGVDQIDVAHIDVEGAEYEVITSFGAVLPKLIYLETTTMRSWLGARDTKEVHHKLSSLGYIMAADLGGNRLYLRADVARRLW